MNELPEKWEKRLQALVSRAAPYEGMCYAVGVRPLLAEAIAETQHEMMQEFARKLSQEEDAKSDAKAARDKAAQQPRLYTSDVSSSSPFLPAGLLGRAVHSGTRRKG